VAFGALHCCNKYKLGSNPQTQKIPAPQRDDAKKLLPEIFKALNYKALNYFVPKEAVPSFAENPSEPLLQQI
jgi:hypothetical protein